MMFHFNLHHITLILIGYLSNISCSPLPFGLLSSQVSGNGITFSHVELPSYRLFGHWKRGSAEINPCVNTLPYNCTAVIKLHGLPIKYAEQSMPEHNNGAICENEKKGGKAKLRLFKCAWEVNSFRQNSTNTAEICDVTRYAKLWKADNVLQVGLMHRSSIWKYLQPTICQTRFKKNKFSEVWS